MQAKLYVKEFLKEYQENQTSSVIWIFILLEIGSHLLEIGSQIIQQSFLLELILGENFFCLGM